MMVEFSGFDGLLLADGRPFVFKGVTWAGSENEGRVALGLDRNELDFYFKMLAAHGFNAVRILFSHLSVLSNDQIPNDSFDTELNPQLLDEAGEGVRYLEYLHLVTLAAARHKLLVVLACDRIAPADAMNNGLWYDDALGVGEDVVVTSWRSIAAVLCTVPNVVGVDLHRVGRRATWGTGNLRTDWNLGAERVGNRVLRHCERWLVFIQGVYGRNPADEEYFEGEDVSGVPLRLRRQEKLILAPHVFGPGTVDKPYFHDANFPANLPGVWSRHFLAARQRHAAPLVIGELGGNFIGDDALWQRAAVVWLSAQKIGIFYHSLLSPDVGRSDGLFWDDWESPVYEKLAMLKGLPASSAPSFDMPPPPQPQQPHPETPFNSFAANPWPPSAAPPMFRGVPPRSAAPTSGIQGFAQDAYIEVSIELSSAPALLLAACASFFGWKLCSPFSSRASRSRGRPPPQAPTLVPVLARRWSRYQQSGVSLPPGAPGGLLAGSQVWQKVKFECEDDL